MANFTVFASRKDTIMQHILTLLQELDHLYNQDSLELYEQHWKETATHIQHIFPGFTIAYAELYNSGVSRLSDAAMQHVLVPQPQMYNEDGCHRHTL
jgi:hypothetical protein